MEQYFLLLQINDALFPIGGYSHSYGLETYIQKDIVRDGETAENYIQNNLCFNLRYTDFLTVKIAYNYAKAGQMEKLLDLDELVEASKTPMEIRSASRKLGSRFIKTLVSMGLDQTETIFHTYCGKSRMYGHHSVAYGVFCAAMGIELQQALQSYIYAQTSAMVTNCVKSIPLSQTVGQQILGRCRKLYPKILENLKILGEADLFCSTPGFDIRSMEHEGLYSRIYMS